PYRTRGRILWLPGAHLNTLESQDCSQPRRLAVQTTVVNNRYALDHLARFTPDIFTICFGDKGCPTIDGEPVQVEKCVTHRLEVGNLGRKIHEFSICHRPAKTYRENAFI